MNRVLLREISACTGRGRGPGDEEQQLAGIALFQGEAGNLLVGNVFSSCCLPDLQLKSPISGAKFEDHFVIAGVNAQLRGRNCGLARRSYVRSVAAGRELGKDEAAVGAGVRPELRLGDGASPAERNSMAAAIAAFPFAAYRIPCSEAGTGDASTRLAPPPNIDSRVIIAVHFIGQASPYA